MCNAKQCKGRQTFIPLVLKKKKVVTKSISPPLPFRSPPSRFPRHLVRVADVSEFASQNKSNMCTDWNFNNPDSV